MRPKKRNSKQTPLSRGRRRDSSAAKLGNDSHFPAYLAEAPSRSVLPPTVTRPQYLPFGELSWEDFERLCYRLASTDKKIEHCQPYGIPGQAQKGIDLYAKVKGTTKYWVYQCKRENKFGPQKILAAVNRFLKGEWAKRSVKFFLCTKESFVHARRADALESARATLQKRGIRLETWDSTQLSRILKRKLDLVEDFFGSAWLQAFCGEASPFSIAEEPLRRSDKSIAETVRQLIREGRRNEVRDILPRLEQCARATNQSLDERRDALYALAEIEKRDLIEARAFGRGCDVSRLENMIAQRDAITDLGLFRDDLGEFSDLRVIVVEFSRGPDAALAEIGPPSDPARMRATLGVLIRADRCAAAAELVRGHKPHERWIDLAAVALADCGESELALKLVERADEFPDKITVSRTRLAFAKGVVSHCQTQHGNDSPLAATDWSKVDQERATQVVEVLDPLFSAVRANRGIQNDFELDALTCLLFCARIMHDDRLLRDCGKWLFEHVPLPLILAEACLRNIIECPPDLPGRLRGEHPGSFQASFLASMVSRELFDKAPQAFDEFEQLATVARTDEEKSSICIALFETCGACPTDRIARAISVVAALQPANSRLIGLLRAFESIATQSFSEARDQLDAVRDESDAVWWQAQAQFCRKTGDEDGEQIAWEKASELLPHPDVLRRSVQASIDRRRFQSAVRGLKKLLDSEPNRERELRTIAWTLAQLGDHAGSVKYLERLVSLKPTSAEYLLSLGEALARTARIKEAIEVVRPLCEKKRPSVQAVVFQSELLEADARAIEAFEVIERIAGDRDKDPAFLLLYVHRAYAAGKDELGHKAFARLLELRQEGKVPAGLLQDGTIEQLLQYGEEYRARREGLQSSVIQGRMLWLYAEDILGNAPIWAWELHTQPLRWQSEEPSNRASFTIYATNGFAVRNYGENRRIERIKVPNQSRNVVVDLTAILTLHQLKRLDQAAEYFGKLIIPASYGNLRRRDARRFGQHQPKREQQLKRIREEIDRGRIEVTQRDDENGVLIDEYSDNQNAVARRLQDLIEPLQSAQKTTPRAVQQLLEIAHKRGISDGKIAPITIGSTLVFTLLSLRVLTDKSIFDPILENFSVRLRSSQHAELIDELRAHDAARSARKSHVELWDEIDRLAKLGKIDWVAAEPGAEMNATIDEMPRMYLERLTQPLD